MPRIQNCILVTKFVKLVSHYIVTLQGTLLRRIKKGAHRLPSYPASNITNQTKRGWKRFPYNKRGVRK